MIILRKSFIDDYDSEIKRLKELLVEYQKIPTGFLGAAIIQREINNAKKARNTDDLVNMLACYASMKQCTG